MGLIGILAGSLIILINPVTQLKKSRDAKVKSSIAQIQTALELYRADCGSYPTEVNASSPINSENCDSLNGRPTITYMQTVPILTGFNYTNPSGIQTYNIEVCLENENEAIVDNVIDGEGKCTSKRLYSVSNP